MDMAAFNFWALIIQGIPFSFEVEQELIVWSRIK